MREAIVRVCNYALVTIEKGQSVAVICRGINYIVVTTMTMRPNDKDAHVALYKMYSEYESEKNIINDMHRIIGKLSMKTATSKYFDNPIWDEHLKNGTGELTDKDKKMLEKAASAAIKEAIELGWKKDGDTDEQK